MLVVNDLYVRYGMHEALTSVNLQVARDEIVVILGANGAGKSSLLSAVAGNNPGKVSGSITLDGNPLIGLDAAKVVGSGVAYVPEGRGVFADLSVEENLQLGSYAEHARQNEQSNLRQVLSLFPKLEERRKQIVRTMSGGEQQMVAIGRALMSAPSILMLDEPSLGLSPLLCKELFHSLKQVRDTGVGILLVEQNAKQSLSISDRGYLLGNGKIIGQDSAQALLNDPNVQAAYLGGAASPKSTKPIRVTVINPDSDQSQSKETIANQPSHSGLSITPNSSRQTHRSTSSNSLINEDIDSLVARASTNASEYRPADSSLPRQVVKLTGAANRVSNSGSSSSVAPSTASATGTSSISRSFDATALPPVKDPGIQALLEEFETAAQNARSAPRSSNGTAKNKLPGEALDDQYPLPHIPVYKKSAVTVYRRDGNGTLRKQD